MDKPEQQNEEQNSEQQTTTLLFKVSYYDFLKEKEKTIYVTSEEFDIAYSAIRGYLDQKRGKDSCVILSVTNLPNYVDTYIQQNTACVDYEGDCDCPVCALKNTVLDKHIHFLCDCGQDYILADNGWTAIICKKCKNVVYRNDIFRNAGTGKWIYKRTNEKLEDYDEGEEGEEE